MSLITQKKENCSNQHDPARGKQDEQRYLHCLLQNTVSLSLNGSALSQCLNRAERFCAITPEGR